MDSTMAAASRPEDEEATPDFKHTLEITLKSYNKIERIDTTITDGNDHLRIKMEYYCLHDSALTVPKRYMSAWGKDNANDFITNNFACKIQVLNNQDTVFNKAITRTDFNSVLEDHLKKYATLVTAKFEGYSKTKGYLIFSYSVSIPMTDVGVPASLTIDKHGNSKIWDEYAKFN